MRVTILDCCCPNPPELADYPNVGQIIIQWLAPHLDHAAFRRIDVWGGETLPDARDQDALVVSGSEMGVYDETQWMPGLRDFLLSARSAGTPMLGICFGHQLMADTFGGRAEKAPIGYAAGAARFRAGEREFDAFVLHGDQVTRIPPGATSFCSADHCPVGGLAYDFAALSFQFHPEYDRTYVDRVTDMLEGDLLDSEAARRARASTEQRFVPEGLFARQAAMFLRSGMSGNQFHREQMFHNEPA